MILSRFWYIITGLALGVALFLLNLGANMYNRAGTRALAEALSADSQVVSWYLRDDARQRAARLIQFAVDPDISKGLQKASDTEDKVPEEARTKVTAALRKLGSSIGGDEAFDAIFAVDQHGRVVGHYGFEQNPGPDFELGGYALVADALHGYIRDDTWILDRAYRVVARPVEYDMGTSPAGAIVGARLLDDRFARELSGRTGAALAFYAAGQRLGSAAPEGFAASLLDQIVGDLDGLADDPDYKEKGRSHVRDVGTMLGVQYSRLPGEAWHLGTGYAVARLPKQVKGFWSFFKQADDKDKEQARLPIAIGLAAAIALIGILFSVAEHTRPLRRFERETLKLARGQIDRLSPSNFGGLFRKIAADVNDGVDTILAQGGGPRRGPADLNKVLGDIPNQPQMSAFSLPGDAAPPPAAAPVNPVIGSNPHAAGFPVSYGTMPAQPVAPLIAGTPPNVGRPEAPGPGLPPAPPRRVVPAPPAPPPPTALSAEPIDPAQAHAAEWRQVYEDFVALKRQCGEKLDGFTYEKFEQTLRKNQESLVQRHGATWVKFSVYVKDGKAALKAAPMR